MGTPAMWTGADDWFKMQRAILGDAEIRNGTKLPENFLMKIRRRTPRRYRGGGEFFRRHVSDALREILPFYPEWREVLRKAPSVSIRKNRAGDADYYGWIAPSVVSWDDTLQRLVLDHVVVELTGELAGFADIYLLGILEHSDNDLVCVLKRLSAWGLWDP